MHETTKYKDQLQISFHLKLLAFMHYSLYKKCCVRVSNSSSNTDHAIKSKTNNINITLLVKIII